MAFPTTPILDSFNSGALQALTARAGWGTGPLGPSTTGYATDATPTLATSPGTDGNYWNDTSTDCECYCTVKAFDNVQDTMQIAARITAVGGTWTAYAVASDRGTTTDFQIVKWVAGGETLLGASPSTTVVPGDGMGISVIGNVITSWYRSGLGGVWVQKDQITDSSITGPGFIGGVRHLFNFTNSFDDFGGGAPVAVTTTCPPTRQSVPFTRGAGGGGKI